MMAGWCLCIGNESEEGDGLGEVGCGG